MPYLLASRKIWIRAFVTLPFIIVAFFFISNAYSQIDFGAKLLPKVRHKVDIRKNIPVKMRDGVMLATDIYMPLKDGKFPVILARTPYGKEAPGPIRFVANNFARRGIAVVLQDCRGRYNSEGVFNPFVNESNDGADTISWIRRQPWANRKIGLLGFSYLGYTAWAAQEEAHSKVKTIVPITSTMTPYRILYNNGVLNYSLALDWSMMVDGKQNNSTAQYNWFRPVFAPLYKVDDLVNKDLSVYDSWLNHPTPDNYWKMLDTRTKASTLGVPALFIGGWYDIFAKATLEEFVEFSQKGTGGAKDSVLIMGPWSHALRSQEGEMHYGPKAGFEVIVQALFSWLEKHLSAENNLDNEPPKVMLFVMGENRWRTEAEWPLARTKYRKMYFRSKGDAHTMNGNGRLSWNLPEDEPADEFKFDPRYPVPTVGGCFYPPQFAGPRNQRAIERRKDVLVYTSEVFTETFEITGPLKVTLYASTSAVDTDFTAKLVVVSPDGRALNLADGIIRARYRNGVENIASFVNPGEVVKYKIDLWATSYVFSAGQKLRVEISSSNFPRFDVNRNTGKNFATDSEYVIANQKIYHSKTYPSYITLPVIPRMK